MKSKIERNFIIFYCILLIVVASVVGFTLNRIGLHMVVRQVNADGIDYDAFREMKIPEKVMKETQEEIQKETQLDLTSISHIKQSRKDMEEVSWNTLDTITLSMMMNRYDLEKSNSISKRNNNYLLQSLGYNKSFQELKIYYSSIIEDIKCFPVAFKANGESYVSFNNSWNSYRSYGGNRRHEGTDLMPEEDIRGIYKIISMTDGVVEKLGWLEQGGFRIGIRGNEGAYYYYAHLDSYAPDLEIGDAIKAGQFLGYMGDSGYGTEGTIGMFDVHLHMGIYVTSPFGELSVNPYWILRYLEKE